MPVRIEDESGVAIVLARARRAVVLAAGSNGGFVEGVDTARVLGMEGDVARRAHLPFGDPEVVAAALLEAEGVAVALGQLVSERRERLAVEVAAPLRVAAPKTNVLDHLASVAQQKAEEKLSAQ